MSKIVAQYATTIPPRVGHFEKVTFERFKTDIKDAFGDRWSDEEIEKFYDEIKLPRRATKGSSGYDIFTPIPLTLRPWDAVKFPTGIRAVLQEGWWLSIIPRSGSGFKLFLRLANTVGNIDMDYAGSDNEGHIWAKIRTEPVNAVVMKNLFIPENDIHIAQGEAFSQGVLLPHGITDDDDVDGIRNGGFGSTNV